MTKGLMLKTCKPMNLTTFLRSCCLVLGWLAASLISTLPLRAAPFVFREVSTNSLGLWEGEQPVFVYNHGIIRKDGVPADRARSTYIHPLYGMEGEVLTDDFPKDHYHHRGLFWAWPHVKTGGKEYDLWALKGIEQRFERWLAKKSGSSTAVLGVKNGWYVGDRKVMDEIVTVTVRSRTPDARNIDLDFTWTPISDSITLAGAEGKSYGGLTLRYAPRTNTVITTPLGVDEKDLPMTRLPWADLSAQFPGVGQPSGAAIFVPESHPDFPPMWLTRHYGVLCLGWPGTEAQNFPAGKPIECQYRLWIHKGAATPDLVKQEYTVYLKSGQTAGAEH